jgi:hypothetical protein
MDIGMRFQTPSNTATAKTNQPQNQFFKEERRFPLALEGRGFHAEE